jgi:hypothetical protein
MLNLATNGDPAASAGRRKSAAEALKVQSANFRQLVDRAAKLRKLEKPFPT